MPLLLKIAQLPRATFYYHLKQMKVPDKYKKVKAEITLIYHGNGYRCITAELHNRGFSYNHETVQRLMKELGLVCRVRIKKNHSYKGKVSKIAPNLLKREFWTEKPNQKWATDVTEFNLFGQKPYLKKFESMEHLKLELLDYLDNYNIRRTKEKLKGLSPAIHRQ